MNQGDKDKYLQEYKKLGLEYLGKHLIENVESEDIDLLQHRAITTNKILHQVTQSYNKKIGELEHHIKKLEKREREYINELLKK